MNLRKSTYFKPLCLLVAALFTAQCVSTERKLISTEEKVIENGIQAYVYELEKVKTPSAQDPTIEYKIVKFPANRAESISTYKLRKVNGILCILLGCAAGAYYGSEIGYNSSIHSCDQMGPVFLGILIGSVTGTIVGALAGKTIGIKTDKGIIKVPTKTYLKKKTDAMPIPVPNIPLEFKWGTGVKSNSFKTQTDEQGMVRINLLDDLKMAKFPLDHHLILYIYYLNPESQKKGIFKDSLGPENKKSKK
ncbi:MAG TPA: hypothetical protein VK186_05660 [Candidatus Deferrimicrobium sp.]|nr:hypothetical protein [Candidatus Deferrimicrobium sp.]